MAHQNLTSYDQEICTCGMTFAEEAVFENFRWWLVGVFQIGINTIGLIGNSISLRVLLSKGQKNLFNMTLTMLTIFDSFFNVTDILECIRNVFHDRSSCSEISFIQTIHIYLWPQVLYPLRNIAMTSSIYMTIVLATERYLAVSRPIASYISKDKREWKSMVAYTGVMVLAIVGCLAPLFCEFTVGTRYFECSENNKLTAELNETMYKQRSTPDNQYDNEIPINQQDAAVLSIQWTELRIDPVYITFYKTVFQAIATGLAPLVSLILLNSLVYHYIRKRRDAWENGGE